MFAQSRVAGLARVSLPRSLFLLAAFLLITTVASPPVMAPLAEAANFTVNGTADAVDNNPGDGVCDDGSGNCTLRAAIMEANALAGPDIINLPSDTYTLTIAGADEDGGATGDLDITDGLTINGADQGSTIIDGNGPDRVFHLHCNLGCLGTGPTALSSLTIRNGSVVGGYPAGVGGGIYNTLGDLTLANITVTGNTAEEAGGGIQHESGTALTIVRSTISGNQTSGSGGGISSPSSTTVTIDESAINNNHAGDGGGARNNNGAFIINNSTITDNMANGGSGGGISNGKNGTLSLNASTVSGNQATGGSGGGINGGVSLTVANSAVTGNSAARRGGGISNADTTTITNSTVSDNIANDNGGGISIAGGMVNIAGSTISGNRVLFGRGGGIHNGTDGSSNGGVLTILNSTISGNQATDLGGGIFNASESTMNLGNVTITANLADSDSDGSGDGGGINSRSGATVNVKNSIIAGNSRNNGATGVDCVGPLNSLGHNLVGIMAGCEITGNASADITGQDPQLGPLSDNGGPTQTHALLSGSPAIDAIPLQDCSNTKGNPIPTDQRGVSRPQGLACDIGAFELEITSVSVCGDQNGDNEVNIFDAIIDLQIIVGLVQPSQEQLRLSDVVRDGAINVFDVILILQHVVGLTVITECGPPGS